LQVDNPNLVVSALKPGRDGSLILRMYEATGSVANGVRVKLQTGLASVSEVNLIEDEISPLSAESDGFQFDARGFEIKTFKLKVKPLPKS